MKQDKKHIRNIIIQIMSVECIRTLYATPIKMKKHTLKIMLCKKKKTCKMDHSIRRLKKERAYKGIEKEYI